MRNASRMARYMMMRSGREGNRGGEYEHESAVRNGYGGEMMNEGGNYARDNYGVDNRFRDRRGREHYDNGRFAPRNNMGRSDERGDDPSYTRARNVENPGAERRGDPQMNMIGFGDRESASRYYPTPWYNETEGSYGARIENRRSDEMSRWNSEKERGGAESHDMKLTPEMAKEWTSGMHNEDGSTGEHWSMEQVKKLMAQRGLEHDLPEVYAVMNSLYSDYCKVFKKYGFNSPEAYMDLALAWLKDSDAVKNKAAMYYECIVKH